MRVAPTVFSAATACATSLLAGLLGPMSCSSAVGVVATSPSPQSGVIAQGKPILGIACDEDAEFLAAARPLNAERCWIVYESTFIDRGQLDENKLRRAVAGKVPEGWNGFACLDIENEWFKNLAKDPESPEFREGARQLLGALRIAKSVRPDAKWSYYGLPNLPFFGKDATNTTVGWDKIAPASRSQLVAIAKRAQIVIDACDWVAPTVYDPYLTRTNPEWSEAQKARVRELVALARELGGAKPVLPFAWHRIHTSNKSDGLALLSNQEFLDEQVLPALQAGAAGVIWWGSDRHMITSGELGRAQPQEAAGLAKNPAALSAYLLRINKEKLDGVAPYFRR